MNDDQIREVIDRADAIARRIVSLVLVDHFTEDAAREAWGLFHYATHLSATDEQCTRFLIVLLNGLSSSHQIRNNEGVYSINYGDVSSSGNGVDNLTSLSSLDGYLSVNISDIQDLYGQRRLRSYEREALEFAVEIYIVWLKISGRYQQSNVFYATVTQTVENYLNHIRNCYFVDSDKPRIKYEVKEPFCLHSFEAYTNPFDLLHYQEGEEVRYAF